MLAPMGRWGADQRDHSVDQVVGGYRPAFRKANVVDPAVVHWITQLQNILVQSYTEQSAYDFKQGFLRLDGSNGFDDGSFDKILQTCVGIANIRRGTRGYVLVGVAEKQQTVDRIKALVGEDARVYEGFYIVGVDREARAMGKNMDQLFQLIIDKVKASKMSSALRDFLARSLKPVRYYDKTVYVFEVESQEDPSSFDGVYYVRRGAQLDAVRPEDLPGLIRRYLLGN